MKKGRFLWSAHRITEKQKAGKARNIKEKQLKNSRSTDLSPVVGSEQGGVRPVLIVQNDVGNKYSPTVIAAAITSQHDKSRLPTHIEVNAGSCGLARDSVVLLEQVRTIDKRRLKERMGALDGQDMGKVDHAISVSFGL